MRVMRRRRSPALFGVLALALFAGAGGLAVWHGIPSHPPTTAPDDAPLPLPPVPPRIAAGEDYEHCLDMLGSDPEGAANFAEAWIATGGRDGAQHCQGLAQIALGDPETGADTLEGLAQASHAPPLARAEIYGQAAQAWLMAGQPDRAYAASTLAVALNPDDADLLLARAVAEARLQRFAEAKEDENRVLDLDPHRVDALVFRAAAERHLNHLDQAEADIGSALAEDPDNAEALLERGILRQRDGNRDGARADWQQAAALATDTATADLAQQDLALLDAGPSNPDLADPGK